MSEEFDGFHVIRLQSGRVPEQTVMEHHAHAAGGCLRANQDRRVSRILHDVVAELDQTLGTVFVDGGDMNADLATPDNIAFPEHGDIFRLRSQLWPETCEFQ